MDILQESQSFKYLLLQVTISDSHDIETRGLELALLQFSVSKKWCPFCTSILQAALNNTELGQITESCTAIIVRLRYSRISPTSGRKCCISIVQNSSGRHAGGSCIVGEQHSTIRMAHATPDDVLWSA